MKDALIIIGIVLGVIVILLLIACIILYFCTSKVFKKLFGSRFQSDPRITFYTKEQFGLDCKDISIDVEGIQLKGGVYSYPGYKEDAVFVYAHGMWSGVCAYLQDIEFFCKKGYQVIALNHEGTDESQGENIRGIANSLRCLDYTINYIKNSEEFKGKDIYVAGHSWGAFATVNIVKYHPDIKGIIAFAPFNNVGSSTKGLFPKIAWLINPFFKAMELSKCGKYANADAIDSLKDYKGKAVILHSKNDNMVLFDCNTKKIMEKYPDFKYLVFEDKFHHPHYSYNALKAGQEFNKTMRSLSTKEERTEYMKTVDFNAMGELDLDVMNQAFNLLMN